jgi:hypothetical protein
MLRPSIHCALFCLALGCHGSNQQAATPATPPPGGNGDAQECEKVKGLARICYDSADPNVACSDLRAAAVNEAAKADWKPSAQQALGELCSRACEARHAGVTWLQVDQGFNCGGGGAAASGAPTPLPGTYQPGLGQPMIVIENQLEYDVTIVFGGTSTDSIKVPAGSKVEVRIPAGTFTFNASMSNGESIAGAHAVEQDNAYTWVFSRQQ